MSSSGLLEKLEGLFEGIAEAENCGLWGIEYINQGRNSILRVYIDSDNGISVEQCASVSSQLSAILDVHDPISGEYSLEVSSPGMERPLFKAEQFKLYAGENIVVRLSQAVNGRRKIAGQLISADDEAIVIDDGDEKVELLYHMVLKAHLVSDFK